MDLFKAMGVGFFRAREVVVPSKVVEVFKADDLQMMQAADLTAPAKTSQTVTQTAKAPQPPVPAPPAGDVQVVRKTTPTTYLLEDPFTSTPAPASAPVDTGAADKALDSLETTMGTYRSETGAALTSEQKQVMSDFLATASVGASPEQRQALAEDMELALKKDRLTAADTEGKTTLDYLKEYTQSALNPGLGTGSKGAVARDLIHLLAHPEATSQGQGTQDCAEATFEATLAKKQPADFARIAVGLATKGEASIPGVEGGPQPDRLTLPPYDAAQQAGRDPISFAMQGAFAHYAGAGAIDEGLTAAQVERLYGGVTGEGFISFTPETMVKNIVAVLQNPTFVANLFANHDNKNDIGKVTIDNGGVLHSLAVELIRLDGASLFDPNTGERFKMPLDEFLAKAVRVTVPKRWFGDDVSEETSALFDQKEGGGRASVSGRMG
ncbi:MAG TPA: hypothetical protein V6D05_08735 [Stenomitos sp.]